MVAAALFSGNIPAVVHSYFYHLQKEGYSYLMVFQISKAIFKARL